MVICKDFKYIISVSKLYIALWNLNKLEIVSLPPTNLGFGGAFPLCRKTQKEGEYFSNHHSWNRIEIQITNDALGICQLFRYFTWNESWTIMFLLLFTYSPLFIPVTVWAEDLWSDKCLCCVLSWGADRDPELSYRLHDQGEEDQHPEPAAAEHAGRAADQFSHFSGKRKFCENLCGCRQLRRFTSSTWPWYSWGVRFSAL